MGMPTGTSELDRYVVTVIDPVYETNRELSKALGYTSKSTMQFRADNFSHAEEQALQRIEPGEIITKIERDW